MSKWDTSRVPRGRLKSPDPDMLRKVRWARPLKAPGDTSESLLLLCKSSRWSDGREANAPSSNQTLFSSPCQMKEEKRTARKSNSLKASPSSSSSASPANVSALTVLM